MTAACSGKKTSTEDEKTIKVGVLASLTGPLESYGKQTMNGFELGLDYATGGTGKVEGKKIKFVVEDTETKADVAVKKATKLLEEEKVDFLVGSSSSSDTLAVLPLAEEYEKIMVVEPAVADSITGKNWNKYIFRTGRNSSQDAVAGAAAIAKKDVKIATLAQDNAYGREGIAAFKAGAGIIESLKYYLSELATEYPIFERWTIILGLLYIIVLLVFPKGLVGTVKSLKNMKRNKKEKSAEVEQNV
ncbi:hypothetical protein BVG01_06025 [Bacillus anthracis]|nr:hypothetical protein BVG01_06025 [Bacillus anthracis]